MKTNKFKMIHGGDAYITPSLSDIALAQTPFLQGSIITANEGEGFSIGEDINIQ